MLGKGVWTYMMLPTTSGEPSWPRSTPVENVQATFRFLTLSRLIWSSLRIALVGVIAGLQHPLLGFCRLLQHVLVGHRRRRKRDHGQRRTAEVQVCA